MIWPRLSSASATAFLSTFETSRQFRLATNYATAPQHRMAMKSFAADCSARASAMNSGAPTFGTPEASQILYGAGQLARRMGLPFRSGGGLCGSKLPDAQAAYETANSLNVGLLSGVNFMLHAAGWLEGGLVSSFEKFVMDADQLGVLHSIAEGVEIDENGQGMDAIREVGPGGHYLGCAHTQANFKDAFWRSTRTLTVGEPETKSSRISCTKGIFSKNDD